MKQEDSFWIRPQVLQSGEEMVALCAGCNLPIMDRYLLNVLDKPWHPDCVNCTSCKCSLTEKCYSRDGKLYCKKDFFSKFGTKCAGCNTGISQNELVRKARDRVFHINCFICLVCRKELSTGEELYVLSENKFMCKADFMNSKYKEGSTSDCDELDDMAFENENNDVGSEQGEHSDKEASFDGDILMSPKIEEDCKDGILSSPDPQTNTDNQLDNAIVNNNNNCTSNSDKEDCGSVNDDANGNKRRGPRTTIKAKQLETLKAAFAATPKPTRHIREQLATETGLNMRVIQVWFQNRRSKERRLKQMSSMGARRHFFGRNPRRIRGSHIEDSPEMAPPYGFYPQDGQPPESYFNNGLYAASYPQEYYNQINPAAPSDNSFMQANTPTMELPPPPPHQGMHDGGAYMTEMLGQTSPDSALMPTMTDNGYPRSTSYNPMSHHPPPIESW